MNMVLMYDLLPYVFALYRYKPNDYYLKQLIGEWCEGILETSTRKKGQLASTSRTSLELQNLLLEKVASHLQDMNAKSLSINLQGLTKVL